MTKSLSPAAQAVLDAFLGDAEDTGLQIDDLRENVAAALEAAADQVVPVSDRPDPSNEFEYGQWLAKHTTRVYLLAIAAELEGL
jgi:hypothetical protein